MKLIKGGNGSIPNWFRFDFLSHFLLSSFSIDFGSTIDRNQSTLIEVINSMSAEKSIEIDRNQIVPSLSLSDEMFEFLLFNHLNSDFTTFGAIVDEIVNGRKRKFKRYFIIVYHWENIGQYWDGIGLETTYLVLGRKLREKM